MEGLKKRKETKEARACVTKLGNLGSTMDLKSEHIARNVLKKSVFFSRK